jgi:hypothetical protein
MFQLRHSVATDAPLMIQDRMRIFVILQPCTPYMSENVQ